MVNTQNLGMGSTFWFDLPLQVDTNVNSPGPISLADVRIMIVADNEINCRVLHEQIISWGMRNGSCRSGMEAPQRLREEYAAGDPYQIVIIDYLMPGMDGLSLGCQIKADATLKPIKLILLTSVRGQGDFEFAKQAGFAAYLTKPVRQSQLMDTLLSIWKTESGKSTAEIITDNTLQETRYFGADQLARLRSLIPDEAASRELFDAFVQQAKELISELCASARNNQPDHLQKCAHKLKGASANLGANRLVELCNLLHDIGQKRNLTEAASLVQQLEEELMRLESFRSQFAQPEQVEA